MTRLRAVAGGLIVIAVLAAGCGVDSPDASPDAVSGTLTGTFSALQIADGFQVQVDRGASSKVEIDVTGLPDDEIEAVISNDILELRTKTGTVPPGASLGARVVVPVLVKVTATSGAEVSLQPGMTLGSPDAAIDLTAGASFSGKISASSLIVQMQAGANAEVTGSAQAATIVGAEASAFAGKKFVVADAEVNLSSGATARLRVSDTLAVSLSSGAELSYVGDAKITQKSVNTGASLRKVKR